MLCIVLRVFFKNSLPIFQLLKFFLFFDPDSYFGADPCTVHSKWKGVSCILVREKTTNLVFVQQEHQDFAPPKSQLMLTQGVPAQRLSNRIILELHEHLD